MSIIESNDNIRVALLVITTSKNRDSWKNIKDSYLYNLTLKTFLLTKDDKYEYKIYIGIDNHDRIFDNEEEQNEILKFSKVFKNVKIEFINYDNDKVPKGHHTIMWNILFKKAYDDNYDYFVQIGSDIYFQDKDWINACIDLLKQNYDIGVVGMTDMGRKKYNPNDTLLTQSFVSRKHMDIFGFYYPHEFKNWFIDDWISEIYDKSNKKFIIPHRIYNCGGPPRYNVYGDRSLCDKMLIKYKDNIKKYINFN